MSGDGTRDRGDTPWGPVASRAGPCSSTGHFSIRVQTGQFRTFCIFLLLYIILTGLNFVYFVKKTAVLGGFCSLASRFQLWDAGGFAGPVSSPVSQLRLAEGHLLLQHLIIGLISTSAALAPRAWPLAHGCDGSAPDGVCLVAMRGRGPVVTPAWGCWGAGGVRMLWAVLVPKMGTGSALSYRFAVS